MGKNNKKEEPDIPIWAIHMTEEEQEKFNEFVDNLW